MATNDKHEGVVEAHDLESSDHAPPYSTNNTAKAETPLARNLSMRQVQMIALAGTIGSGLFLSTGKALHKGGPASLLIAYAVVGIVVYLVMLALGEMAAYIPVSGSFGIFASRFVNEAFGFSIQWNYWFNAAVSVGSDLVAAQLLIAYWNESFPGWAVSLIFWVFLITVNLISVRGYGETEYILALLKITTIIVFIILGICVNAGANTSHHYIGGENWHIPGAPFVGGIGGFASVFVSAAFAYGGTEGIGVTAGETRDPAKAIPKITRNVFIRIVLFYILSLLIVGLNVPWDYPKLSSGSSATSPFTIVFQMAGSQVAGSFINAVILSSVLSAGNHALYAGTRLMFSMSSTGQAPRALGTVGRRTRVPWAAVLLTSSISVLCFGSSFIGAGEVFTWLQNLVGVSNQLSWVAIGIASIRFRRGLQVQGKLDRLPYHNWTQPWGPWVVVIGASFMVLIQGWSAFAPWDVSSFFSYYVELLILLVFYLGWCAIKRRWFPFVRASDMDLDTNAMWTERRESEEMDSGEGEEKPKSARKKRMERFISYIW